MSIGSFSLGPQRLATQLTNPLSGFEVIHESQPFLSLSRRVSSSEVFVVDEVVVIFVGLSNGHVQKVYCCVTCVWYVYVCVWYVVRYVYVYILCIMCIIHVHVMLCIVMYCFTCNTVCNICSPFYNLLYCTLSPVCHQYFTCMHLCSPVCHQELLRHEHQPSPRAHLVPVL